MSVRPAVVREAECPWEGWTDPALHAKSPIRWKLLVGAERTPSRSLTVGTCEIPPGASLLLHHHAPGEVYYVLDGEGVSEIDEVTTPVGPGTTLYIPPDARHRTRNTGSRPLRFVWIFATDSFGEITYHYDE
ncbi:MAG TPA: cupin domain-containing protein [Methylomirabilota bacterium]|jgi:mannose-6-phosphate isomerase-like protein (cupin superfamily)|nr:cupin domain-containing protein [Methylomirabilota bacterium]